MVNKNQNEFNISFGQMNLLIDFRNLWLDIAEWTRTYFVRVLFNIGGLDAVGNRLYQVPLDLYNRLQMIFGIPRTQQLVTLLSNHIIQMMNLANAMKNKNDQTVNSATQQLYQNSVEISNYMRQINPLWSDVLWNNLFDQYIRLMIEDLVALASGNYTNDINVYDRAKYQTAVMSDYMTDGVLQFLTFNQR